MPYAIPQSQLYGARGSYADGGPVRNRGQEQFNTTSGNPGMPIFNTQQSPQQGTQTYGGQPQPLGYSTTMSDPNAVSNSQLAQAQMQPGNTNNFSRNIMPQFNNWNGGGFVRGGTPGRMPPVQTQPSPGGAPLQRGGAPMPQYGVGQGPSAWQQAHDAQMQNDPNYARAVAQNQANRQAWYARQTQVPPTTLPIQTTS